MSSPERMKGNRRKYAEAVVEEGSSPLTCGAGIIEGTPSLICQARVGRMHSLLRSPLTPPCSIVS